MSNYRILADSIADDIVAGRLPPGERLLPQREFAYQNRVAPSTAGRVYAELLHRGLVIGEVGRGTFVAAQTARTGVVFASAQLYAFDLLELDGDDLRGEPIERRKHALTRLLGKDRAGLLTSRPIEAPADIAFQHICQLGLEGIVSKKLGSRYESGRSSLWLKSINPDAPALQRLEQVADVSPRLLSPIGFS